MSFMASKKMLLSGARPLRPQDVFATSLFDGTGTSGLQVTNGLDLLGKGGLIWNKSRTNGQVNHHLVDSVRGVGVSGPALRSNTDEAEAARSVVTALKANGFTVGNYAEANENSGSM